MADEAGGANPVALAVALFVALVLGAVLVALFGRVISGEMSLSSRAVAIQEEDAAVAQLVAELNDAEPLPHCATDPAGEWITPASSCPHVSDTGQVVLGAGSHGLCVFAPQPGGTAGSAPELDCVIVSHADQLWQVVVPPAASATATTCPPAACFGPISAVTACENAPSYSACSAIPGNRARLLGKVVSTTTPFTYETSTGATLSSPVTTPSDVALVHIHLSVVAGGRPLAVDYVAVLSGVVNEEQRAWNAAA